MSFLRPSALYQLLITFNSLKWMPCMFFGYPNFQGIIRLVIMFLLWSTFTEMCHISSSSMSPTLRVGDRIFVEKASYFFRRPALHDIVIFRAHLNQPSFREGDMLIKRIVARAGDLIEVHDGRLYVNGLAMKEDFVTEKPKYAIHPTYVPRGHVYVLGDNRNNSCDSHIWGSLPIKNVVGRCAMRYYRRPVI
ncbi:hypothetical protein DCAR_0103786 [Daucus carota subsp. sativus]|uniref:signal peptidase I n=1 Tax=Daucus carota subsp. sativus TaxID=79200 RepID=A0AAF1AL84_DAUCS|nr:PREDICTED: chloroplast processing peptidase-like isoform X1 [Daucus carota subsp. sativus]WOG84602.1 hypothetical protein DCAR_0103786 [Daucus carota subsp. sativus]